MTSATPRMKTGFQVATAITLVALLAAVAAWLAWPVDRLTSAEAAYAQGDWTRAVAGARVILSDEPARAEALRLLARGQARLGRDESALTLYRSRLESATLGPEDAYLQGLCIGRLGNPALALKTWEEGAALTPEHPELLRDLARLATETQHLDLAVTASRRLGKRPGWEAVGNLQLGAALALLDDPAGAAEALKRGLDRDPTAKGAPKSAADYARMLTRSLLQLNRPAEARRYLSTLPADQETAWLASRLDLQEGKASGSKGDQSIRYRSEHPMMPEPAAFLGSSQCDSCHTAISDSYRDSRHARTFHRGAGLLALPLPEAPLVDPDDPRTTYSFEKHADTLSEETRTGSESYRQWVAFAVGTPDRYVSMVGRDDSGAYHALRLSHFHDAEGAEGWDRTSGDDGDSDPSANVRGQPVPTQAGVARCVYCHTTNPRDFRDLPQAAEGRSAASADRGIGCERCHGPGTNHLKAVAADLADHAIVNAGSAPASTLAATVNQQCAECHTVADRARIRADPENPRWVRSTGLTLTLSRCYTESAGALSCLTCHDPHRDSAKSASFYEKQCLKCHTSGAVQGKSTPSTVCKVDPTKDCLNCHMPKVPMPVLHTGLTDHYIRVRKDQPVSAR